MTLEHDQQALAAYVAGALTPDERAEVEAHVAGCPACAGELRSLMPVAGALARAVPQRTPPAALRARVLDAVGVHEPRAATDRAERSSGRTWLDPRVWLPAAALVALAAGTAIYAARLQNRLGELESGLAEATSRAAAAQRAVIDAQRVADEAQFAMAVLAAPDLARIDLAGQPAAPRASARALWSRRRGMVFAASDLPPLPAGRVYQVWVITAAGPISAGLLEPDPSGAGLRMFNTPPDIPPPTAVAVTLEQAGGAPAPTVMPLLAGKPSAL